MNNKNPNKMLKKKPNKDNTNRYKSSEINYDLI